MAIVIMMMMMMMIIVIIIIIIINQKARNQGATENRQIGHCTHAAESTNVKVQ
jgi:hypothetical protein